MRIAKSKEIETKVGKFGNSCHVIVPKQWLGKTVKVMLATTTTRTTTTTTTGVAKAK